MVSLATFQKRIVFISKDDQKEHFEFSEVKQQCAQHLTCFFSFFFGRICSTFIFVFERLDLLLFLGLPFLTIFSRPKRCAASIDVNCSKLQKSV